MPVSTRAADMFVLALKFRGMGPQLQCIAKLISLKGRV